MLIGVGSSLLVCPKNSLRLIIIIVLCGSLFSSIERTSRELDRPTQNIHGNDVVEGQVGFEILDELIVHAAKLRRMRALNVRIPKDLPVPGDYVLSRLAREQMPDFQDRTEPGIFLGLAEHVANNGSKVLVERDGRVVVRFARLPILLDKEASLETSKESWIRAGSLGAGQRSDCVDITGHR